MKETKSLKEHSLMDFHVLVARLGHFSSEDCILKSVPGEYYLEVFMVVLYFL